MTLTDFIHEAEAQLDLLFKHYLIERPGPATTLQKAMAYAVLNGGKHIRPLLVYLTGRALHAEWEQLNPAACAVEFIHAYSLIHDDLPAMDNSDLRRGKPTCHKMFGDAMAILAGDALQPLAFEVLATHAASLSAELRLDMTRVLSRASGANGMAAGQALDLAGMRTLTELIDMYSLKTGSLLTASVMLGAVAANIDDPKILSSLQHFAECVGLAFQIQDDLLDVEGSSYAIGKPQGIDKINQKITYVSLVGIEQSREEIENLFTSALLSIEFLGSDGELLREFIHSVLQRKK